MNDMEMIRFCQCASMASLAVFAGALLLSVVLFLRFDIGKIICRRSGRSQRKAQEELEREKWEPLGRKRPRLYNPAAEKTKKTGAWERREQVSEPLSGVGDETAVLWQMAEDGDETDLLAHGPEQARQEERPV